MTRIRSLNTDDLETLSLLKKLSSDLLDEARSLNAFNLESNLKLMKTLASHLTKPQTLLSYELKESGLLDALKVYLTMTPRQAEMYVERQRLAEAAGENEEQKRSDEIKMSQIVKNAQTVSKKEAKNFILRLKVFFQVIIGKVNGK